MSSAPSLFQEILRQLVLHLVVLLDAALGAREAVGRTRAAFGWLAGSGELV